MLVEVVNKVLKEEEGLEDDNDGMFMDLVDSISFLSRAVYILYIIIILFSFVDANQFLLSLFDGLMQNAQVNINENIKDNFNNALNLNLNNLNNDSTPNPNNSNSTDSTNPNNYIKYISYFTKLSNLIEFSTSIIFFNHKVLLEQNLKNKVMDDVEEADYKASINENGN